MMYVRLPCELGLDDARGVEPVCGAEEKGAEEERAEQRPQRGVPPEQSDGDAEEADLAERDVDLTVVVEVTEHVHRAGQAGERAGDRHRADQVLLHADAAVRSRVRVEADRPHLVAERRPVEQDPEDDERSERDEDPDVEALEALGAPEDGQLRARRDLVRDRDERLGRVLQRTAVAEEPGCRVERDPVEHDRRDHLVGADRRLEHAGDPRPGGSGERRRDDREQDVRRRTHRRRTRRRPSWRR